MTFLHYRGRVKTMWFPKAASQAFSENALTYFNGSGALIPADSTSGDHAGVIQRAVTSADSDYATSGAQVPVLVPMEPDTEWLVDVDSGTALTTAMVGEMRDLYDSVSINAGGTSKNVVTITKFVSATKAVVVINAMLARLRVATS